MYVKCYYSYNVPNMYYKEECGEEILMTNIEVPICRVMITALFKKVHVDEHISVYFIHYMLSDSPAHSVQSWCGQLLNILVWAWPHCKAHAR